MSSIIELGKVRKGDDKEVGEKASLLGEAFNIVPVPASFVLKTKSFQRFVANHRQKINNILVDPQLEYEEKANQIQSLLKSFQIPTELQTEISQAYEKLSIDYTNIESAFDLVKPKNYTSVVLRANAYVKETGSPLASSYKLGINKKLNENIQETWIDLFCEDTIEFMDAEGLDFDDVGVSLIVSKMVLAHKSGVMYSTNPEREEDQILVEACWGTDDYFLIDDNEPDRYDLDKEDLEIENVVVEEQQYAYVFDKETREKGKRTIPDRERTIKVLKDNEIVKLGAIARKLENHFGKPVEAEFIIDKSKAYVTQIMFLEEDEEILDVDGSDEVVEGMNENKVDDRYPGLDAAEDELIRINGEQEISKEETESEEKAQ